MTACSSTPVAVKRKPTLRLNGEKMTKRIKMIVPVPLDEQSLRNYAGGLPTSQVAAGFEPEFVAVKNGASTGDSYYEAMLMDTFVFEAGLRSQDEGYDAVCIDTMSDSALYALRSRLNIPVLGPGQLACHIACVLGHTFSIVAMWEKWFHFYRKNLTEAGLWHKVASLRHIDTRPDTSELLAGREEVVFEKLEAESRIAIEQDGAGVIVLGSTTMHQSYDYLQERLPVPVVDPGLVMHKICEDLIELGVTHSKKSFRPPETIKDSQIFERLATAR